MALPSSGSLGLAEIQNEFGGTVPISLSEYYGAASGIPTSGAISISHFYGKSANSALDSAVITVGYAGGVDYGTYGYIAGYSGTISDNKFAPKANATITGISCSKEPSGSYLYFALGSNVTNSGWTTMTIANSTANSSYDRTSAYFYGNNWLWTLPFGANPMGEFGSVTITWT